MKGDEEMKGAGFQWKNVRQNALMRGMFNCEGSKQSEISSSSQAHRVQKA